MIRVRFMVSARFRVRVKDMVRLISKSSPVGFLSH